MKFFFLVLFSACILNAIGQNPSKLKISPDQTYGYTQTNPLVVNQGNAGKSYDYFMRLVDQLITDDGQGLEFLNHFTVREPGRILPLAWSGNNQQGTFKKLRYGVDGQVERYQFLTEKTRDTITLFVDLSSRGKLLIPMKLKLRS